MSATTWLIIAIVGFSLSGIALVVAIFMFIKMDIPAVIGDLTGKTVAREIQARRDANAASGNKIHKSSSVNANRGKLTEKEIEMLPMGAKVITFEQAIRFLTDYLQGDVYFKIHRPEHNLDRARTQFKLVADMEAKWETMKAIVEKYK